MLAYHSEMQVELSEDLGLCAIVIAKEHTVSACLCACYDCACVCVSFCAVGYPRFNEAADKTKSRFDLVVSVVIVDILFSYARQTFQGLLCGALGLRMRLFPYGGRASRQSDASAHCSIWSGADRNRLTQRKKPLEIWCHWVACRLALLPYR